MKDAHEKGTPVMRPLFYDFPDDQKAWSIEDEYLFGGDVLVAPVLNSGSESRSVYLPEGATWTEYETGIKHQGGSTISVATPIDRIPIFFKNGKVPY